MHMLTTGYAINWKQIHFFAHTQLIATTGYLKILELARDGLAI